MKGILGSLVGLLVVTAILFVIHDTYFVDHHTHPSITARPVRTHRLRPDYWPAQADRSDPASADVIRLFDRLHVTSTADRRPIPLARTVPNTRLPPRIVAALNLIRVQRELPHAWEWQEVRRLVLSIRTTLPLELMSHDYALRSGDNSGGHYNPERHRIGIRDEYVQDGPRALSVEEIAGILIHEVTHALYDLRLLSGTGYRREELVRIRDACHDMNLLYHFNSEGLAHINEVAWVDLHPPPSTTDSSRLRAGIYSTARRWIREERDSDFAYASALLRYYTQQREGLPEIHAPQFCGPLVILRGTDRGRRFYPSDVAPHLLVDLVDALQIIMRYTNIRW